MKKLKNNSRFPRRPSRLSSGWYLGNNPGMEGNRLLTHFREKLIILDVHLFLAQADSKESWNQRAAPAPGHGIHLAKGRCPYLSFLVSSLFDNIFHGKSEGTQVRNHTLKVPFSVLWLWREPGVMRSNIYADTNFSGISTSERVIQYSRTSLPLRHHSCFFFPTANVYQTCIEHANITDQIHRKTGCCLQHISCFVALTDVKWRLRPSCFKGIPYPKCESNLLELLNVGSTANCRGFPTSPLYGRAASRFCREGGLKTPDQTAGVLS